MPYIVTYKGAVVAGPFIHNSDADHARWAKAKESGLSVSDFKIESC